MTRNNSKFAYEVLKGEESVMDEKGNSFLSLRKMSWGGNEPKLELRRWFLDKESGDETCGKGVVFQTPEGPDMLTLELVNAGYGCTDGIIDSIRSRSDFEECLFKELKHTPSPSTNEESYGHSLKITSLMDPDKLTDEEKNIVEKELTNIKTTFNNIFNEMMVE